MIFLETERLYLRSLDPKDLDIMHDYRNDPLCTRYQRGQTKAREKLAALIERHGNDALLSDDGCMAAVVRKDTDEMVGEIVVMRKGQTVTLGYTMSYHHHRQGYAFEALSALLPVLHRELPEYEVICLVEPENIPSIRLLEKLGFEDLGYEPRITSQVFGKWALPES